MTIWPGSHAVPAGSAAAAGAQRIPSAAPVAMRETTLDRVRRIVHSRLRCRGGTSYALKLRFNRVSGTESARHRGDLVAGRSAIELYAGTASGRSPYVLTAAASPRVVRRGASSAPVDSSSSIR